MSASRPDAERPAMPTSARVGVVLLVLLAVLLLLNAALTWLGQETIVARLAEAQGISEEDAAESIRVSLFGYLAIGISAGVAAPFLARRRRWARWLGLTAALLLGLLSLLPMISAGGVAPGALLTLLLCVGTVTSLMSATTTAWLPAPGRRR